MTELYINNTRVELESEKIALTKQINNFAELKNRQSIFSTTLNVPWTPKNIELLDGLGIEGNRSRAPYTVLDCRLIFDSVAIVSNGTARVSDFTTNGFSVTIFDGNKHLYDTIGNKTLADLDLTASAHDLTEANYIASFANTSDYIYAISDYGNFDTAKILINYQMPSFYLHTIWDKIFSEAGYTKDFTPELDLVITPKRGYNSEVDAVTSPVSITATDSYSLSDSGEVADIIPSSNIDDLFTFAPDQSIMVGGEMTIVEDGNYTYSLTADFTYNNLANIEGERIVVLVNGVIVITYDVTQDAVVSDARQSIVAGNLNLLPEDVVTFRYRFTYAWDNIPITDVVAMSSSFTLQSGVSAVVSVLASSFIGEIKQVDFIKDLMQHYGLIFSKEKDANDINFVQAKDMLSLTNGFTDMSDKYGGFKKKKYTVSSYAQNNIFAYRYREDGAFPFADGDLEIANENLISEKTHLTRPYNAPEISSTMLNSGAVRFTPMWEAKRDDLGAVTDWKSINSNNYLGRVEINSESINYGLVLGSTLAFTGNVPRLAFTGLKYQELIVDNYSEIKSMLDWNKIISVILQMDAFEFDELDLLKPIFIKQLGGYYYINKIKYNGETTAEAEIIYIEL